MTHVTCPALPADVRAEFEARAQVDLTLRSAGGGDLDVACDRLALGLTQRAPVGETVDTRSRTSPRCDQISERARFRRQQQRFQAG